VVALLIGCWVVGVLVISAIGIALGRAAAVGDRRELELAREARERLGERRVGPPDRRSATRPWASGSPGLREADKLRAEVAERQQRLREAELRLAEVEARRTSA
jgi:hypothetical protein